MSDATLMGLPNDVIDAILWCRMNGEHSPYVLKDHDRINLRLVNRMFAKKLKIVVYVQIARDKNKMKEMKTVVTNRPPVIRRTIIKAQKLLAEYEAAVQIVKATNEEYRNYDECNKRLVSLFKVETELLRLAFGLEPELQDEFGTSMAWALRPFIQHEPRVAFPREI